MSVAAPGAEAMVNTERYPMDDLDSDSGIVLAKSCREEFVSSGLCIWPGFIRPDALDVLGF